MELKNGYKQTEVGVIPEDWKAQKLNELINKPITYGIVQPGADQQNGVFMIRSQDYTNGWNPLDTIMKVSFEVDKPYERSRVSKGDLLITVVGSNVGRMAIVPELLDKANISRSVARISINTSKFDSAYCYHILVKNQNELVQANQVGGAQPVMNLKELGLFYIPLPPTKSEQTAIATALSDADALISRLETLIAKKRAIKQGAMQQLLKPKEGWVMKKLGEVLRVRHGKSQKDVIAEDGDFPILASGGVIGRAHTFLYDKPSVLIGRKGTIDVPQYMNTPFWSVDTLFYTEIFEKYDAKFIFYVFNLIDWYSFNEASGVPSLNAKTIEGIEKYFPKTKSEQSRIAQILSDMDAEITGLEQNLAKYKRLKQGMMQELLTGKTRLI